jgi:hypothetical protein
VMQNYREYEANLTWRWESLKYAGTVMTALDTLVPR